MRGTRSARRATARAAAVVALVTIADLARAAEGADPGAAAALEAQRRAFKAAELDALTSPALRERLPRRITRPRRARPAAGTRPVTLAGARPAPAAAGGARPASTAAIARDVRVNGGAGYWTQAEPALGVLGRLRLVAWNEADPSSTAGALNAAYSTDAGVHWKPATPPLVAGILRWEGDPVIAADPVRGEFWLCALAVAGTPAANTIALARAAIADTGLVWRGVEFAVALRDTFPDKPWLDVDPATGDVAVAYTSFWRGPARFRDRIDFVRRDASGAWSRPLPLSSPAEEGLVQAARVVYGSGGVVHASWAFVDTSALAHGRDTLRIRTSRDAGRTFGPPAAIAGIVVNFGSGAPGFNRWYGPVFPSLAVDRSDGPTRGRLYMAWVESADFYAQKLGPGHRVPAREGATFELGDVLCGVRAKFTQPDRFTFTARRGETAVFLLDSLGAGLDVGIGVGCGADPFEIANSDPPAFGRPRALVVTFPRDGRFVLAVASELTTGGYRLLSGRLVPDGRRGRDVRDVFVATSDDAVHWNAPVRVSDAPPCFDDWLPEVAVGPTGDAYVAWFDWRDSPATGCTMASQVYLARSTDGGASWRTLGPVSGEPCDWRLSEANAVPNQGDYLALVADSAGANVAWTDARRGTPDVFFAHASAPVPIGPPAAVALGVARPNPARGTLAIACSADPARPATLELWDVAGRRVQAERVPVPPVAGELTLVAKPGLAAGVYVVRLVQGGRAASRRVVLLP